MTNGHNTLSVTWRKPSDGAPAISGYSVRHWQASSNGQYTTKRVSDRTTTTTTITGLSANSPYEEQVRAGDVESGGRWSEPGNCSDSRRRGLA